MWEMQVAGLVLSLIFLYVLYHVIRAAVRDGVRAARDAEASDENDASASERRDLDH